MEVDTCDFSSSHVGGGCTAVSNSDAGGIVITNGWESRNHPDIIFTEKEGARAREGYNTTKWFDLAHGFRLEARTLAKPSPGSEVVGSSSYPVLYYHYKDRELDASPLSISPSGKYALLTKDYPTKLILFNTVTGQMKAVGTMDVGYGKTEWNEAGGIATINSRYGQPPIVVHLD